MQRALSSKESFPIKPRLRPAEPSADSELNWFEFEWNKVADSIDLLVMEGANKLEVLRRKKSEYAPPFHIPVL